MNPTNATITRDEIAQVLRNTGVPGEALDEKRKAVENLFQVRGQSLKNSQGINMLDELNTFGDY